MALCAWGSDALDPKGIAAANSSTAHCLRVLRAVCVPRGPGTHVSEPRERAIHAFVTLGVELICKALADAVPWAGCKPAFESLLGAAVCRTVPLPQVMQAAELSLRSVVSVINPLRRAEDVLAATAVLAHGCAGT